jgi:putative ABC transport system substrate-binding protein
MRRREFIAGLGGTAAWPLVARAQQSSVPVIGFLHPASIDVIADRVRAFHQGLKDTGFIEGENVALDYRWAEDQIERLPALAAELVRRQVKVIAAVGGNLPVLAAKTATATIPIVFAVGEDPVGLGLVESLARPGGNLTGINFLAAELHAKRLGLLHELVPNAVRVAVLINPGNAVNAETTLRDVQAASGAVGLQIHIIGASTNQEIDAAFATMEREPPDALLVGGDPFFNSRRVQLVLLATRHAVPAIYASREYAEIGGLISYGTNFLDSFRNVGVYVGRILKGAKPADMPIEQSTRFELVINLQAAKAIGYEVPAGLVLRADTVIE